MCFFSPSSLPSRSLPALTVPMSEIAETSRRRRASISRPPPHPISRTTTPPPHPVNAAARSHTTTPLNDPGSRTTALPPDPMWRMTSPSPLPHGSAKSDRDLLARAARSSTLSHLTEYEEEDNAGAVAREINGKTMAAANMSVGKEKAAPVIAMRSRFLRMAMFRFKVDCLGGRGKQFYGR